MLKTASEKVPLFIVAVTAVVTRDGKFLAGKRSESEVVFPGKWTLPGGKVEAGQTIEQCLRQEVREEAGVEIKNIQFVSDYTFTRPDGHNVLGLIFQAESESGETLVGEDMTEMKWLTVEEAEKLDFIPGVLVDVKKALTK